MKKKILFVIPGLGAGGAEKSLVNLLNQIDYNKYDVDLFLFCNKGLFLEFLPKEVNILPLPKNFELFILPFKKSLKQLYKNKRIDLLIAKLKFTLYNYSHKKLRHVDQYNWKYQSNFFETINNNYDVAIGFLEKTSIYFCVDKVIAKKKIGFIHNDYNKLGLDSNIDIKYFEKLDNIITVSPECLRVLEERFPLHKHKMSFMYNILSTRMINNMANSGSNNIFNKKNNQIILLSIGRLTEQKGFDIAIKACKILVDKGFDIKWYIIGEGGDREILTQLIKENNLEDRFILLGLKSNPYPYIKQADIYVQPSRFEGKSIALDEAKILHKVIIITNYSTAKDQINNNENGIIVEMNSEGLSKGIISVIHDVNLQNKLKDSLCNETLGTESEIYKLYDIFK